MLMVSAFGMAVLIGNVSKNAELIGNHGQLSLAHHDHLRTVGCFEHRRRENTRWWSLCYKAPVQTYHLGQMSGDRVQVVSGQDHRDPLVVELGQQMQDVVSRLAVDPRGRLAPAQEPRFPQQGASQEKALLRPDAQLSA